MAIIVEYLFVFVFGAVVGSFLNVCIYRIPAGESIVSPPSRCPKCGASIRWYQNIPVLSWVALRGRCASCKISISWRYPLIEVLTGVVFLGIFLNFGVQAATVVYWLMAATFIVIAFIDIDHQIIPDVISLPGILIGFVCSFFIPWITWVDSLLGIVVGGGSLLLIALTYEFLTKKEGMGGGDVKLLAMIGAFLGWKSIFPIVFISSLIGTIVGVPTMLIKKADGKLAIPFGPFLVAGAVIFLFWGTSLIHWYLSFFR